MKATQKLLVIFGTLLLCLVFQAWYSQKDGDSSTENNNTIVLVKYKSQPSKESETVSALNELITHVQKEPHFVNIKLHVDPKDPSNILLYEEWNDESYFNTKHMATQHLQKFIEDSKNFLAGPPEISFWKIEKEYK